MPATIVSTSHGVNTSINPNKHSIGGIDASHPLYIHHSNSPGIVLVSGKFNGMGYGGWRRGMLIGLSCNSKLGLINGSIPMPEESDPLFEP